MDPVIEDEARQAWVNGGGSIEHPGIGPFIVGYVKGREAGVAAMQAPAMTPEQIAQTMDAMSSLVESTASYKNKMEAAGMSPTMAEQMALQWHSAMWATYLKSIGAA